MESTSQRHEDMISLEHLTVARSQGRAGRELWQGSALSFTAAPGCLVRVLMEVLGQQGNTF